MADGVVCGRWQAIDYARLSRSTISFFNLPETVASRWNRVSLIASKVYTRINVNYVKLTLLVSLS